MKEIPLTKGFVALVDDRDYNRTIAAGPWHARVVRRTIYADHRINLGCGRYGRLILHRFIMGITDPTIEVDHEDHNGLNCQRYNLRVANRTRNMQNRQKQSTPSSSQYKGVERAGKKWKATICVRKCHKHLGYFFYEEEAARAYDSAALLHFGEFSHTNFPND